MGLDDWNLGLFPAYVRNITGLRSTIFCHKINERRPDVSQPVVDNFIHNSALLSQLEGFLHLSSTKTFVVTVEK